MTRAMRPYAAQLKVTAPMISYNGAETSDPVTGRALIADGLAPALKRRGAIRDGYTYTTLNENIHEF